MARPVRCTATGRDAPRCIPTPQPSPWPTDVLPKTHRRPRSNRRSSPGQLTAIASAAPESQTIYSNGFIVFPKTHLFNTRKCACIRRSQAVAGRRPMLVSGVSGEGVPELLRAAWAEVRKTRGEIDEEGDEVETFETGWTP